MPLLALAAVGLVYGSLLAFRAPDLRGVIAYSSLAQLGLITLGLFALNDQGFDGAVLQMVVHGLISTTLFLLAGGIERRTSTGEFALLGGMARGRPALATMLMTTGVIALAVPGSAAFAGEFLILLGVFDEGWGWAVVGAVGDRARRDVHAPADLGRAASVARLGGERRRARPSPGRARDPRAAARLRARALRVAGGDQRARVPGRRRSARGGGAVPVIPTPSIDWLALSPTLAPLARGGARAAPVRDRAAGLAARPRRASSSPPGSSSRSRSPRTSTGRAPTRAGSSPTPRGATASPRSAQMIVAGAGLLTVGIAYSDNPRQEHVGEYFALLATAAAGMMFMVSATSLVTLFLGLEWFSISLYVLCAIDIDLESSLESGLKYLIVGSFGSAVLLFGFALVFGATGHLDLAGIGRVGAGLEDERMLVVGLAMVLTGLGFKASAAPFHMWTPDVYQGVADARDRVHVGRDEGRRARRHAARPQHGVPGAGGPLDGGRRGARGRVARDRQPRRARAAKRQAAARVLVRLARGLHADPDRRGQRARRARRSSTT